MNKKLKDGGPAFPRPSALDSDGFTEHAQEGMSLRDYFAAAAMQGWMSTYIGDGDNHPGQDSFWANNVAKESYVIADAMLAARKEKP